MPLSAGRVTTGVVLFFLVYYLLVSDTFTRIRSPIEGGPPLDVYERRIVALGDLHGDLPNALTVLKMTGVIDEDRKWTGDVDFLVQTGDMIDRGDDTLLLFELMDDLRTQAKSVGGQVLSHLGNHEYMNAIGDWRYVYNSEIKTFGSVAARQEVLSSGWLGRTWRSNYTVTSRLPLHHSLGEPNDDFDPTNSSPLSHAALSFVHGGISPTYLDATPYPSHINTLGASLLRKLQARKQPTPHPPGAYPGLPADATKAEHELYGADGPLWYRGWALDNEAKVCGSIDAVLKKIGVRHLVMGHTLNYDGIISRCDGKILLIDTGMSPAYGGILSAIDVRYSLTPVVTELSTLGSWGVASAKQQKFVEKETIHAIYPNKRDLLFESSREVVLDPSVL